MADPRASFTGQLGTDLSEMQGSFDAKIEEQTRRLKEQKRSVEELQRAYHKVYGKHMDAIGADEMQRRVIDGEKQLLRMEEEKERLMRRNDDYRIKRKNEMRDARASSKLWMMEARMRGEIGEEMGGEEEAGFGGQLGKFRKGFLKIHRIERSLRAIGRLGQFAMGAEMALSERSFGSLAFMAGQAGEMMEGMGGRVGGVGKLLGAVGPWITELAGPLMLAYLGGEVTKAALEAYEKNGARGDAGQEMGAAGAAIGQLAKSQNSRMGDIDALMSRMRQAWDKSPNEKKVAMESIALQAADVSAGRKPITKYDVSTLDAENRIYKRRKIKEAAGGGGEGWWTQLIRTREYDLRSDAGAREMLETAKDEIVIERIKQREANLKHFDESLKERIDNPEYMVKRFQNELKQSAFELDRTRSRMMAPTI